MGARQQVQQNCQQNGRGPDSFESHQANIRSFWNQTQIETEYSDGSRTIQLIGWSVVANLNTTPASEVTDPGPAKPSNGDTTGSASAKPAIEVTTDFAAE